MKKQLIRAAALFCAVGCLFCAAPAARAESGSLITTQAALTEATVRKHSGSIYAKLGVKRNKTGEDPEGSSPVFCALPGPGPKKQKKSKKNFRKVLTNDPEIDIIAERHHGSAMMREVAAGNGRFFRGVCPEERGTENRAADSSQSGGWEFSHMEDSAPRNILLLRRSG